MSTVLVTGATGFIGRHLVEALLRRGERVRCLVRGGRRDEALRKLDVELVTAALDQPAELAAAVAGAEAVYHLAGLTQSLTFGELSRVNGEGTAAVAVACAEQSQPPRLIYVSSLSAAGPAPRGQILIETDPPAPDSDYGRSKLAGENAVRREAAKVPSTIVRPGVVFGPRDPEIVRMLQFIVWARFHLSPGLHPPALSFIYVADLVELLLRAADHGSRLTAGNNGHAGQGIYFATAAEHPTYAELGMIVRPMVRRPWAPVISLPAPVAWCVAGFSEGLSRIRGRADVLNLDKMREALATNWACSGEAASRELGFTPARPLEERLRETIDWYRAEGWL